MKKYIGKFIGSYKIKEATKAKRKTYLGNEAIEVKLNNEEKREYPKAMLDQMITKEKSDLSELREKRVRPVVEQVITICAEAELNKAEIQYALGAKMELSLNNTRNIADSILWGKDIDEITLYDIEQVFKKNKKKNVKKKNTNK